jgi:hypothetical protein
MKNLKVNWKFIGLILIIFSAVTGIIYGYTKESKECDLVVFIDGQLSIDARRVIQYKNGFTSIKLCSGETEICPTDMIIKVVEK